MGKRSNKIYNIIFPVWLLIYCPPFIFPVALANLVIDGTLIWALFKSYGVSMQTKELRRYIIKVWLYGFLADIAGSVFTTLAVILSDNYYYQYGSIGIISAGLLIFYFNYRLAQKHGLPQNISLRIAAVMGVLTAPWVFLVPLEVVNSWFHMY